MNILTNEENVVIGKGIIEYGVFDEPFEKWKVIENDITYYILDMDKKCNKYEIEESETIPIDCVFKYCYTVEQGFYINTNYVEPIDYETETRRLIEENEELKTTVSNLENSNVESYLEIDFRLSMLELGLA